MPHITSPLLNLSTRALLQTCRLCLPGRLDVLVFLPVCTVGQLPRRACACDMVSDRRVCGADLGLASVLGPSIL